MKNLQFVSIFLLFLTACNSPIPSTMEAENTSLTKKNASEALIYLIALEDQGRSGTAIGCGDSLVPVKANFPGTTADLRAALQALLAAEGPYHGESGLYNALYQSKLEVHDVWIEKGIAYIKLEGKLQLGGVCDNPRLEGQLKATALQFDSVDAVQITINGLILEELLSLK